jgi:hypothetical protein
MLSGWTMAARVAAPLLLLAAAAASVWAYGHGRYKAGELAGERTVKARYTQQRTEAEREDRRIEQRRGAMSQEVQDGYAKKATRARADAVAARTELDGLRSDLAARAAKSPDAATASRTDGPGTDELLGECAFELTRMAESADQTAARLNGLQSWVTGVCLDAAPSRPAP